MSECPCGKARDVETLRDDWRFCSQCGLAHRVVEGVVVEVAETNHSSRPERPFNPPRPVVKQAQVFAVRSAPVPRRDYGEA